MNFFTDNSLLIQNMRYPPSPCNANVCHTFVEFSINKEIHSHFISISSCVRALMSDVKLCL